MLSKLSTYYILPAMVYSGARKVVITHDAKYKAPIYDDVSKKVVISETPLLMTDRAMLTVIGFCLGAYMFPFHIIKDMRCVEIHLRGLEKKDYDNDDGFMSYILD